MKKLLVFLLLCCTLLFSCMPVQAEGERFVINSGQYSTPPAQDSTHADSAEITNYAPAGTPIRKVIIPEAAFFTLAQTLALSPSTEPYFAAMPDLVWSSSNEDIATVENGLILPVAPGEVVITCASAADPSVKAECYVTIRAEKQLILPVELRVIRARSFYGTDSQEIVLPEGVAAIGTKAFANSTELAFIHMPDSLIAIANDAFAGSDNVVFICSPKGCAAEYAAAHGIETIHP